jgi:nicotinamide-nucleotide adenylyltransferase
MIEKSFEQDLLARITIVAVPDINDHSKWVTHLKSYVPEFDVVYSNNELVAKLFGEAGMEVKAIKFIDRGSNEGRYIRKLMRDGNAEWLNHVPNVVAKYIISIKGIERMQDIQGID